jgi:colanic acid/amylovoran biosynthesis glycosyltransferase
VEALQHLDLAVHVVCEHTENLDQFGVNNLHCLSNESHIKQKWDKGLRKLRIRRHLNYLVEIGEKNDAKIVHSHFGNIAWANLGAVHKLGAKHVVTFYGLDVNKLPVQFPIWRKRYYQLFEEADLFLCEGSYMARSLVELGCPDHKVKVQHLGVDVEQFKFTPRHWNPGEPLKVLIAASFREKKGIPYAIEALGLLSKNIPIELTIIGDAGSDSASQQEKIKIFHALESAGLNTNTRLLGYQPHSLMMQEAYAHHIFLHPSVSARDGDTEGGAPVCIIEMLATGMPVVSSIHCDIPEVVGADLLHLLAEERNVKALADCLENALKNSLYWEQWALTGRHRVEAEYHKSKQAEALLTHYKTLVAM